MSKWVLVDSEHLNDTWQNSRSPNDKISNIGDEEYINLWKEHYSGFSGKILEIGAGNGFLAKNILEINKDVDYTILDIESHFEMLRENIGDNVTFVASKNYESVFEQEWDLLIETHCLSETPTYYYADIFNKLKVKNCFVIDYGNSDKDPYFQPTLDAWFNNRFANKNIFTNTKLIGGSKKPIPVYIGKEK